MLKTAIMNRLDDVGASDRTKMAVLEREAVSLGVAPDAPQVGKVKNLIARGVPVLIAAANLIAGGFGLYLGVTNIQKAQEDGDNLGVAAGALDVIAGAGNAAVGAMETAALFSLRATIFSAFWGAPVWGITVAATLGSFILNIIRAQREVGSAVSDYQQFVKNIYKDGLNRDGIEKPSYV